MELWLIILISCVGGFLLFILIFLAIWSYCRKRTRKSLTYKDGKEGQLWQYHDHIIEIKDENSPKLDGLCKDTISGSTFPRRFKKYCDENENHKQEDGLCRDTRSRSLRRGNVTETFQGINNQTQSSLSHKGMQKNMERKENVDDKPQIHGALKNEQRVQNDVITNGADEHSVMKQQWPTDNDSSTHSYSKTNGIATISNFKKGYKNTVERKRSKSIGGAKDVPEYTKPIKRAISNPSIVARQKMIQKDKRFESLDAWKCSIPIPEPDYPLGPGDSLFPSTNKEEDIKGEIAQSTATSDSGVEFTDCSSRDGDESDSYSADFVQESGGPYISGISIPVTGSYQNDQAVTNGSHQLQSLNDNQVILSGPPGPPKGNFTQQSSNKVNNSLPDPKEPFPSVSQSVGSSLLPETNTMQFSTSSSKHTEQFSDKTQPVFITRPQSTNNILEEKTDSLQSSFNNGVDFRSFKLRATSESIKQQIGFLEERETKDIETSTLDKSLDMHHNEILDLRSLQRADKIHDRNALAMGAEGFQLPTNGETGSKVNVLNQDAQRKTSTEINQSQAANIKSADLVIQNLRKQAPGPGKGEPINNFALKTNNNPANISMENIARSAEDKRRNWKREQMEHRLSTELVRSERQPLMHASGLALKSVMPELFSKIKERDQKEEQQ